jgi:hypothetical protein
MLIYKGLWRIKYLMEEKWMGFITVKWAQLDVHLCIDYYCVSLYKKEMLQWIDILTFGNDQSNRKR